jgi:hypothetical protein
MENPLDAAGELVENAGQHGSEFLFGLARYIEHLTSDATTAVIFTGFLLFALGLLGKMAMSRNSSLYSKGMIYFGLTGIFGVAGISAFQGYIFASKSGIEAAASHRVHYAVFTNRQWGEFYWDEFQSAAVTTAHDLKWYALVFGIIFLVGLTAHLVVRTSQKIQNTVQGGDNLHIGR